MYFQFVIIRHFAEVKQEWESEQISNVRHLHSNRDVVNNVGCKILI